MMQKSKIGILKEIVEKNIFGFTKKIVPKTLRETFKTEILLKLNKNFQINLHNCGVNFNLYYNILNLFDRLSTRLFICSAPENDTNFKIGITKTSLTWEVFSCKITEWKVCATYAFRWGNFASAKKCYILPFFERVNFLNNYFIFNFVSNCLKIWNLLKHKTRKTLDLKQKILHILYSNCF
jgi:hypothetical protein